MVEYNLAKVGVAGSIPVSRSLIKLVFMRVPGFWESVFRLHNATLRKFFAEVFPFRKYNLIYCIMRFSPSLLHTG